MHHSPYARLLLILCLSFVIMYIVMFLNVDQRNHIYLSTSRTYMALLMVLPMSVMMIALMSHMYPHRQYNMIFMLSSIVLFVLALIGLRTQTPIGDKQYMHAMISHHSSAILTSEQANIEDSEVQQLAQQIIDSQKSEIAQMKQILGRMKD